MSSLYKDTIRLWCKQPKPKLKALTIWPKIHNLKLNLILKDVILKEFDSYKRCSGKLSNSGEVSYNQ